MPVPDMLGYLLQQNRAMAPQGSMIAGLSDSLSSALDDYDKRKAAQAKAAADAEALKYERDAKERVIRLQDFERQQKFGQGLTDPKQAGQRMDLYNQMRPGAEEFLGLRNPELVGGLGKFTPNEGPLSLGQMAPKTAGPTDLSGGFGLTPGNGPRLDYQANGTWGPNDPNADQTVAATNGFFGRPEVKLQHTPTDQNVYDQYGNLKATGVPKPVAAPRPGITWQTNPDGSQTASNGRTMPAPRVPSGAAPKDNGQFVVRTKMQAVEAKRRARADNRRLAMQDAKDNETPFNQAGLDELNKLSDANIDAELQNALEAAGIANPKDKALNKPKPPGPARPAQVGPWAGGFGKQGQEKMNPVQPSGPRPTPQATAAALIGGYKRGGFTKTPVND